MGFRARPDLISDCITAGRTAAIDAGMVNGKCFMVVAGMGFDAEVVERLVQGRTGHITHLSYTDPIWRTFWTHRFPEFRVIHEGRTWWEGRGMLFVGNIWRYSLGLPVVRDAIPNDGLLDLLILPCTNKVQLLAHSIRTVFGRHIEHGGARYLRFERLRIESPDAVPFELDGDCGDRLPVDFEVRPGALQVRLPPA
jgi:diacylglycerol kinase family enzyme